MLTFAIVGAAGFGLFFAALVTAAADEY